jgi:hypothetical protein
MAVFIHLNLYDIYLYFKEFSRIPNRSQNQQFLSHSVFYRDDPSALAGLVQWNSARGIKGVVRSVGFKFVKRRGRKLLFKI